MTLFGSGKSAVDTGSSWEKQMKAQRSEAGQRKQQESVDRANSGRPQRDR